MKVMVVDDNKEMRQMICRIIGDRAVTCECDDGAKAFTVFVQHRPDLVLMDLEMKEMDGLTATRQLKAAFPQANICIVTNYDDEYLREEARSAGACAYVLKDNLYTLHSLLNIQTKE